MNFTALPPQTVRDRIMQHLLSRFAACVEGQGGRYITWNTISDAPLKEGQKVLGNAIGVFDSRERKKPEVSLVRAALEVNTEFHVRLAHGDNPVAVARAVLGEVQAIMLSDIYCTEPTGQLSLNIVEIGNELDVDGPDDKSVSGIVFWEIQYRHQAGNSRKLQGE